MKFMTSSLKRSQRRDSGIRRIWGKNPNQNLINAINDSKQPALANFIYSLGIPNVGLSNAKLICKHFKEDFNAIREADAEDFIAIDQIGPMIAEAMVSYFHTPHNQKILEQLLQYVQFEKKEEVRQNRS